MVNVNINFFEGHHHHHGHHTVALRFAFNAGRFKFTGEHMQVSLQVGFQVSGTVQPLTGQTDGSGNPIVGTATLSNLSFTSSDSTVFTVAVDPSTPNGFIVTAVGSNIGSSTQVSATLTASATATETNGAANQVQGAATVNVTAAPPPPPPVTTSLGFTFGTPVPVTPPPSA